MTVRLMVIAVLLLGLMIPPSKVWADGEARSCEGSAEGLTAGAAKERAMRDAVEKCGKIYISSQSGVKDFTLIRDAIYTKASGILRDVEVLEEKAIIGGTFLCRLRATVVDSELAREWGEIVALLEANGNPRIIVTINEVIDGAQQQYSTIESKIAGHLAKKGFKVLDSGQVKVIGEREGQRFDITDIKFLQWVARNQGADVFVQGSSSASFSRWHDVPGGVRLAMYNCNADISVFNADDASVIVREHIPSFQDGARTDQAPSVEAGKMALDGAGDDLLHRVYAEAVRRWAGNIAGSRDCTLEVRGVPNLGCVIRMENMLRDIKGVTGVNRRFDSEVATLRINADMSCSALATYLVMGDWANLITVEEEQLNVLRGAYIGVRPEPAP